MTPDPIRAAGVVAWRDGPAGAEILVIHRPHHGDWSIPKGKLDPGERWVDAAVREAQEETGVTGELGTELSHVAYEVDSRPKVVRYWSLLVTGGEFVPNDEVDEIRWLPVADAIELVDYQTDRAVLASWADRVGAVDP